MEGTEFVAAAVLAPAPSMKARLPEHEAERLDNLRSYNLLDTAPEIDFDDITRLAAQICETPIALVTLVDEKRQWFKSRVGLDASETPREQAFCAHAILQPEVLVVPDATADERFADNELVLGAPNIRFYAGAPLISPEGFGLGTLCVIDQEPRRISDEQASALEALSRLVSAQLKLRRSIELRDHAIECQRRIEEDLESRVLSRTTELQRINHQLSLEIENRKVAERELHDSTQVLQLVLDHIPQRVFWKDHELRFSGCNRALAADAGLAYPKDIAGLSDFDFYPEDQARSFQADDRLLMETAQPKLRFEERVTRSDGSIRWVETSKVPLHGPDGQVIGILGTYEDVTDWKTAQEELIRAKEAAEQSARAKAEFLTNMSHELRTPMNGILALSEFLISTEEWPTERTDALSSISDSARSLMVVLNDILDFSDLGAGRMDLMNKSFHLKQTVEDVVRIFYAEAHRKSLNFELNLSGNLPVFVCGDSYRLRQVLVNLIANAVKFTNNGGVLVRIDDCSSGAGETSLHFVVEDTGIGIPPEKLDSIFEPFTQVDGSLTRQYGGTGLGLSICRQIVSLMKGRIWVFSTVGGGSQFHFTVEVTPVKPNSSLQGCNELICSPPAYIEHR